MVEMTIQRDSEITQPTTPGTALPREDQEGLLENS